ncbi:vacuolar transporter chaperone [Coelomomyces lativittatus]|nr:vacuolar transporter chaperone [Coelomomyces lativittatus]
MKFGVHLKSVQLPVWRYYYIDYDSLKKKIKSMSKEGKDCPIEVESEFVEYLTRELNKVASFQFVKSGELHRRAEHCEAIITNIYANVKSMDPIRLDRVEEEIQRITLETNHLSRFTRLNYTGFLKILKKHDKHTSFELKPMFIAELNARPFFRENFDEIILKLSLLYDTIRNHGLPRSKGDYDESAAHSFVRKTTKYWVHPDNVTEVKLKILKYLPVLIYGSKREYDPAISSVYFDNDQFELYKGRLEKTHESQAFRFRWYGSSGQQEIFAERKTHREDWTGEKSVKERFPIKDKRIDAYLKNEWNWEAHMNKMLKKKEKPESVLKEMLQLANEMQHTIQEKKLVPILRTFYNRTAFQLPGDARVRISLDTELAMIRESHFDAKSGVEQHWRRMDVGTEWPFNDLDPNDIHRFPYAVLEVKLQTQLGLEPPLWVQELVESHLVEAVPKFSKFVHGCATLFESRVSLLPFWLPQMDQDIRKPPFIPFPRPPLKDSFPDDFEIYEESMEDFLALDKSSKKTDPSDFRRTSSLSGRVLPLTSIESTHENKTKKNSNSTFPSSSTLSPTTAPSSLPAELVLEDEDQAFDETTGLLTLKPTTSHPQNSSSASSSTSSRTISAPKYSGILGQMGALMRALRVVEKNEPKNAPPTHYRVLPTTHLNKRIVVPVRVEPKVFFANERTFLAWLHFAALISGLALGLLNFGDHRAKLAGCAFCVVAIGVSFYALHLFLWRSTKIRNHEPGPYDDRGGPVAIVIILILAIALNFWLKFMHSE